MIFLEIPTNQEKKHTISYQQETKKRKRNKKTGFCLQDLKEVRNFAPVKNRNGISSSFN